MKDIYRELAKRSIKDSAYLAEDVTEEYDITINDEMVSKFALNLYRHRVQEHRHKRAEAKMEAEAEALDPENTGGIQ